MTAFDKITQSPESMAAFITTLVIETENRMLAKLDEYGIQASVVRPSEDVLMLDNLAMLLEEVPDGNPENT